MRRLLLAVLLLTLCGCGPKLTRKQCDQTSQRSLQERQWCREHYNQTGETK